MNVSFSKADRIAWADGTNDDPVIRQRRLQCLTGIVVIKATLRTTAGTEGNGFRAAVASRINTARNLAHARDDVAGSIVAIHHI